MLSGEVASWNKFTVAVKAKSYSLIVIVLLRLLPIVTRHNSHLLLNTNPAKQGAATAE